TEVADTGNMATNGTNLNNILNGTTKHGGIALAQGDTIVLQAGVSYLAPTSFTLKYIAGVGTITIESSDIYYNQGGLVAGKRVGASVAQYMPKLLTGGSNNPIIKTEINGGNPTHDYALKGLEICPLDANEDINVLVQFGDGTTLQETASSVANNFLVDQ